MHIYFSEMFIYSHTLLSDRYSFRDQNQNQNNNNNNKEKKQ